MCPTKPCLEGSVEWAIKQGFHLFVHYLNQFLRQKVGTVSLAPPSPNVFNFRAVERGGHTDPPSPLLAGGSSLSTALSWSYWGTLWLDDPFSYQSWLHECEESSLRGLRMPPHLCLRLWRALGRAWSCSCPWISGETCVFPSSENWSKMEPSSLTVVLEPTNLRVAFLILRNEHPTPT